MLVDDLSNQPHAAAISDFISYWAREFHPVLGEGFIFILYDLICKVDKDEVTEQQLHAIDLWNLEDYSNAKQPQLHFAKAFTQRIIKDENFFFYGCSLHNESVNIESDSTKRAYSKRRISFHSNVKYKSALHKLIREISNITNGYYQFLSSDTDVDAFIDVFTKYDLEEESLANLKFTFGCKTHIASYILYKLCENFTTINRPYGEVFKRCKIFYTQNGVLLKSGNLSAGYARARDVDWSHKSKIDLLFKNSNPFHKLDKQ